MKINSPAWEFLEHDPLCLKVSWDWGIQDCEKWINDHVIFKQPPKIKNYNTYYTFPDLETKTEFLLKWT